MVNQVLQKFLLIHDSTDEISTGWFFNCSAQISVLKRKMMFNQRGSRISWNRISDRLPIVFHCGTENWEEQLKKTPCISILWLHFDKSMLRQHTRYQCLIVAIVLCVLFPRETFKFPCYLSMTYVPWLVLVTMPVVAVLKVFPSQNRIFQVPLLLLGGLCHPCQWGRCIFKMAAACTDKLGSTILEFEFLKIKWNWNFKRCIIVANAVWRMQ